MFRCIAGSEYYSPYDCNPGEVGYSALKIADEVHPAETGAGTSPPETGPTQPTPPEAAPTKSPKLKLLKLKRNRQRGVVFIRVHVSGEGRLILSGPSVRRAVRAPKVSRSIWIPIRPKGKAMRALDATASRQGQGEDRLRPGRRRQAHFDADGDADQEVARRIVSGSVPRDGAAGGGEGNSRGGGSAVSRGSRTRQSYSVRDAAELGVSPDVQAGRVAPAQRSS